MAITKELNEYFAQQLNATTLTAIDDDKKTAVQDYYQRSTDDVNNELQGIIKAELDKLTSPTPGEIVRTMKRVLDGYIVEQQYIKDLATNTTTFFRHNNDTLEDILELNSIANSTIDDQITVTQEAIAQLQNIEQNFLDVAKFKKSITDELEADIQRIRALPDSPIERSVKIKAAREAIVTKYNQEITDVESYFINGAGKGLFPDDTVKQALVSILDAAKNEVTQVEKDLQSVNKQVSALEESSVLIQSLDSKSQVLDLTSQNSTVAKLNAYYQEISLDLTQPYANARTLVLMAAASAMAQNGLVGNQQLVTLARSENSKKILNAAESVLINLRALQTAKSEELQRSPAANQTFEDYIKEAQSAVDDLKKVCAMDTSSIPTLNEINALASTYSSSVSETQVVNAVTDSHNARITSLLSALDSNDATIANAAMQFLVGILTTEDSQAATPTRSLTDTSALELIGTIWPLSTDPNVATDPAILNNPQRLALLANPLDLTTPDFKAGIQTLLTHTNNNAFITSF